MDKIEKLKLVPIGDAYNDEGAALCRIPSNKEIMIKINEIIDYINNN